MELADCRLESEIASGDLQVLDEVRCSGEEDASSVFYARGRGLLQDAIFPKGSTGGPS